MSTMKKIRQMAIINEINSGKSIAMISDAGTPLISDPGYHLVSKAKKVRH